MTAKNKERMTSMKNNYRKTMYACFVGYIVQAIVNNFLPLLFVTFRSEYGIPLSQITLLVALNFAVQLAVDMLSAVFIDRIGCRASVVIAHICAAAGLIMLAFLPDITPDPFAGILASVFVYAIGGGIIEVIISPIIEGCPTDNKEKAMSLLHSFYCWGHMGVVLLSTAFFALFGTENRKVLTLIWAVIPIVNAAVFSRAPIFPLNGGDGSGLSLKQLFRSKTFLLMMLMMVCAGASEQAVSQWASAFAEQGLGVSKTTGDLAGPMSFALLMGLSRLIYGKYGERIDLDRFIAFSSALCIASYLCIALLPVPALGLAGCAVCGFSVGILWPGTYSKASAMIKDGGTAMFAMLALAGDVGCSGGPALAGFVSDACGGDLKKGILAAVVFPVLMLVGTALCSGKRSG